MPPPRSGVRLEVLKVPSIGKVVSLIQGVSGTPGYSVHYFTLAGTVPTNTEAADVASRVRAMWAALVAQLAANVIVVVDSTVQAYDVASGGIVGFTGGSTQPAVTATGTGELPPMSMLGLQLQTNTVIGRRLLAGRTFIGPLATNVATTGGIPTATARSAVLAGGTALLTGSTSSQLVVWHRPSLGVANGSTGVVTQVDCALKFWSLRSRRD